MDTNTCNATPDIVDTSPSYPGRLFCSRSPPSSPSPSPRPERQPFSLQNRRLQLRNANFRGGLLAQRQTSPQIPIWGGVFSGAEPDEGEEGTAPHVTDPSRPGGRGITASRSPPPSRRTSSSILHEIGKSTQRRSATSSRPSVSQLFQSAQDPSTMNQYYSPPAAPTSHPTRTEVLTDAGDGSLSSQSNPFGSLERPKRRQISPRRDTSRYIQHLETQLAASLERADTTDTSASVSHASRIKSLTAEVRVLKQEVNEWETKFDDQVQDELSAMVERESQFRARVRGLEKEAELRENRIRELEWEAEMDSRRLRKMEAVKSTNRNLEKRIDVLTGLLAQSSTRTDPDPLSDHGLDNASPENDSPTTSTPRPKSMFSKVPLSPVRRALYQSPTETQSITGALEETSTLPNNRAAVGSISHSLGPSGYSIDGSDLDSGLGDSGSAPSTRAPESQRSSMISHSSSGSSFWHTSFPLSPEFQGKLHYRQRRMRCFPSGSSTLKPLVLPTAAGTSPVPTAPGSSLSSPIHADELNPQRRVDATNDDIFLSQDEPLRIHDDSLEALEGNTHHYQTFEEAISGHSMSDELDMYSPFDDEAQAQQTGLRNVSFEPDSRLDTGVASRGRSRQISSRSSMHGTVRRKRCIDTGQTHSPIIPSGPSKPPQYLGNLFVEITRLPLQSIKNLFPHSTSLARRVVVNSWHANWGNFRKISWWILGFVLGKRNRDSLFATFSRDGVCNRCSGRATQRREFSNMHRTPSPGARAQLGTRLSVQGLPPQPTISGRDLDDANLSHASPQALTRSVQLWARFSFALVLAVGLAIRDGPGSLMCDCLRRDPSRSYNNNPVSLDPPIRLPPTQFPRPTLHDDAKLDTHDPSANNDEANDDNDDGRRGKATSDVSMNLIPSQEVEPD